MKPLWKNMPTSIMSGAARGGRPGRTCCRAPCVEPAGESPWKNMPGGRPGKNMPMSAMSGAGG